MEFQGWLQIGAVFLLLIGGYFLIRRPLQRKKLFDLAAGKTKRRGQACFGKRLLQQSRR